MTNYDEKIRNFKSPDPDFYAIRRLAQKSQRLVDAVKDLEGVRLELRGYALCVFGKTHQHKEALKKP